MALESLEAAVGLCGVDGDLVEAVREVVARHGQSQLVRALLLRGEDVLGHLCVGGCAGMEEVKLDTEIDLQGRRQYCTKRKRVGR